MNMEYAMQRKTKSLLNTIAIGLVLGAALLPGATAAPSRNALQELRCEYLVDPQGIDVENPRLSWVINAAAGIPSQSAYRILVAGSLDALRKDHGDLPSR